MLPEIFYKRAGILPGDADIPANAIGFETKEYKKGEVVSPLDKTENHIYYLSKGAVKVVYPAGEQVYVLDFWFGGDFFSSYTSFISRKPAVVEIIAIAPTEVYRISRKDLDPLYASSRTANQIGRFFAEQLYIHKTQKEMDILTMTAEARYRELIRKSPDLIRKIPVKDLASYLGIHPESLSRIRRKLIS